MSISWSTRHCLWVLFMQQAVFSSWMPQFDSKLYAFWHCLPSQRFTFGHARALFGFLQGKTTKTVNEWQRKCREKRRVEKCFVLERVMFNICHLFCQVWPVLVWMFDTSFVIRSIALYSRPLKKLFFFFFLNAYVVFLCECVFFFKLFFLVTWGLFKKQH